MAMPSGNTGTTVNKKKNQAWKPTAEELEEVKFLLSEYNRLFKLQKYRAAHDTLVLLIEHFPNEHVPKFGGVDLKVIRKLYGELREKLI